ncbi:hypothetical protein JCM11251_004233 [Rhodosporidiobolus azoricus]
MPLIPSTIPRLSSTLFTLVRRSSTMSASEASTSTSAATSGMEPPARAQLLLTSPPSTLSSSLETASALLHASLPVAFPTETVYGLGASALSSTAVKRIFAAKGRPSDNPLIVHVSSREMLEGLLPTQKEKVEVALPKMYKTLMDAFWPGALSLVFPLSHLDPKGKGKASDYDPPRFPVAPEVLAGHASLCIRMPSHPLALSLIRESNLPLAAPSANLSSRPSPTTAQHVIHDLGEGRGVGAVLDGGECEVGVESTVVDWVPPADGVTGEGAVRILRAGGVTAEEIEACLQKAGFVTASSSAEGEEEKTMVQVYARDFRNQDLEDRPTTPGMKYKHYAPGNAKVLLVKPVLKEDATDDLGPLPSLQDLVQLTALTHAKVGVDEEGRTVEEAFRVGLMLTEETLKALEAEVVAVSSVSPSTSSPSADTDSTPSTEVYYDIVSLPPPPPSLFSTLSLGEDSNLPDLSSLTILSYPLGSTSRPIEAAQRLFSGLRLFDGFEGKGVDLILVEAVKEEGVGLAVMERARKAAGGVERGGEMEFLL